VKYLEESGEKGPSAFSGENFRNLPCWPVHRVWTQLKSLSGATKESSLKVHHKVCALTIKRIYRSSENKLIFGQFTTHRNRFSLSSIECRWHKGRRLNISWVLHNKSGEDIITRSNTFDFYPFSLKDFASHLFASKHLFLLEESHKKFECCVLCFLRLYSDWMLSGERHRALFKTVYRVESGTMLPFWSQQPSTAISKKGYVTKINPPFYVVPFLF